ncbi:MAG: hypothetical protein FJ363_00840 [Gemmatimonadetes bacterium]|nr:hypothetical protein [Gemmatimonadota bacterium]
MQRRLLPGGCMGLLDKLQVELNRAGKAAQDALDEGRLRLEIFRVRQLADKAAQALGYAVYRAKAKGEELDAAAWERLSATLRDHEAEATRLDAELAKLKESDSAPAASAEAEAPPPAAEEPPKDPPSA